MFSEQSTLRFADSYEKFTPEALKKTWAEHSGTMALVL